jgi:hypothetical protein
MKKYLFSSKTVLALLVAGAVAAVPAASASAAATSSTVFATLQGTSVLGQEVPVLGTQGYYVTLPVGSNVLPGESLVWEAIDFTITSDVKVGNVDIAYLYVDPKMAR